MRKPTKVCPGCNRSIRLNYDSHDLRSPYADYEEHLDNCKEWWISRVNKLEKRVDELEKKVTNALD